MSDFLKKMQESVETGKFNSEIANRINEIDAKADEFIKDRPVDEMGGAIEQKIGDVQDMENVGELNSEYEDQMEFPRLQNEIGVRVAHIMNLDQDISNQIGNIKAKINEVKVKYSEAGAEKFPDLFQKINDIEKKYTIHNI